ncbi:hypothetical protein HF521_017455 [Silurus meridionalis]|uniref:Uncharacterized protein n=1 Tax=Silurus meridionalis TaxID=175797 RepID=A0A8T0BMU6_SILME|nr:hypothetical protein HF521_017455 [Silurus meridionalis]
MPANTKIHKSLIWTGAGPPIKPFEEGMAEVFRQFMHAQEQQEQRYLQALQTLQVTMQQAIQPASSSLGLESPRMELPTPAPGELACPQGSRTFQQ